MLTEKEVVDKYKDTLLSFTYHEKHCFHFKGIASDGAQIVAFIGGCPDYIYREFIENNEKRSLNIPSKNWNFVQIEKDGNLIFDYHDV